MEGTGPKLKKIRLEKGISLEDAAKKTKVHLNILQAIEEERIVSLNRVYLRGFLKIYCKFLEVDPREYIPQYKEPEYALPERGLVRHNKPVSFLRGRGWNLSFLKKINWRPLRKWVILVLIIFAALALVFKLSAFISVKAKNLPKKAQPVAVAPLKKEAPDTGEKAERSSPASSGIRFGIQSKEDCFVDIKVDGKVVLRGNLKRGRLETWQAKEKVEVSLGNAGVVTLQVNDRTISDLGRKGQPLKNIIITKDGVNIKKKR